MRIYHTSGSLRCLAAGLVVVLATGLTMAQTAAPAAGANPAAGAAAPAAPAGPAAFDIPDSAAASGLQPAHLQQIDAHLDFYAKQLLDANSEAQITAARDAILTDYRHFNSSGNSLAFQSSFAGRAATLLMPAMEKIKKTDPLRVMKEVNLALAMSKMPHPPIQPALEQMIRHGNPAVRCLGWYGYNGTRTMILSLGSENMDTMFKSLRERASQEDCPGVIGAMCLAMTIPPASVQGIVGEANVQKAQANCYEILQAGWPRWCNILKNGSDDMAAASLKSIAAVSNLMTVYGSSEKDKDKVPVLSQMVLDQMWCSALAYDLAKGKGEVAITNAMLLRDCEDAFKNLTQTRFNYVDAALSNDKVSGDDRGVAVRTAVYTWLGSETLKKYNLKQPPYSAEGGATMPASAPAN